MSKPIGTDIFFKEIFPGDTIKDASGKSYTVTSGGFIKPLDGGAETTLAKIDQPMVCDGVQEKQPTPAPEVRPVKIIERKGGKENKSGLVPLCNLARKLHTKQVGFARTLRENGVEVVKGKGGYSIRVADVKRSEEILAPLSIVPQEGGKPAKNKRETTKRTKLTDASGALLPGEFSDVLIHKGNVKSECLEGEDVLRLFSDQQLADELRRRGYELTATKTITVTL